MPLKLVLDTNVWLDWLLFNDAGVAPVKAAAASARVEIFIDDACAQELARVLARFLAEPREKKTLNDNAQAACLAECRRIARRVTAAGPTDDVISGQYHLPVCRDPDDQKFLALALACRADYLVTKDRMLLELARRKIRRAPFGIVTPAQLNAALAVAPRWT